MPRPTWALSGGAESCESGWRERRSSYKACSTNSTAPWIDPGASEESGQAKSERRRRWTGAWPTWSTG
eukprot:1876835-Rhodomonas_salina.2